MRRRVLFSAAAATFLLVSGTGRATYLPTSAPVTTNPAASGNIALAFAPGCGTDIAYNLTLTGPTTLTLSGATAGCLQRVYLAVLQDATGGHALTLPAGVKWQGGTAPTLATAAGALQVFHLETSNGGTTVTGF